MHPRIQNHVHQETYVWSLRNKSVGEPNPYKKLNMVDKYDPKFKKKSKNDIS